MLTNKSRPVRGLTEKQKTVLAKLGKRDYPVTVATLACSPGVCERLATMGLAQVSARGVGNLGARGWEITRNGLVLLNLLAPGSVPIPPLPTLPKSDC